MPKLLCACGHVHDLSPIPDEGYVLIRDRSLEEAIQPAAEKERWERIYRSARGMYECPKCGRIMIERKERSGEFRCYRPED